MKKRSTGVVARGIRTGLIKEGDNLEKITLETLLEAAENEGFTFRDRDVVAVTESLVARAQGNFVKDADIGQEIEKLFGSGEIGILFPIFSRNRFFSILKAICAVPKITKIYLQLHLPKDEQGNNLVEDEIFLKSGVNAHNAVLTADEFRKVFPPEQRKHRFTGMDYLDLYQKVSSKIEIILSNDPTAILAATKNVLVAHVHNRPLTIKILKEAGAEKVYSTGDILTKPIKRKDGSISGYCPDYSLLGSNMSKEGVLKLFPRDGQKFVEGLAAKLKEKTGKSIEVMIYGDGAFKDPIGGIWELADPVVSPAYTSGLEGTPDELKIKYLTDSEGLSEQEIMTKLKKKKKQAKNTTARLGTTPRRNTDILGSLADLVSGSGDRGTPVVLIQGFFDNLSAD